jgi:hypothetical protein
MKARHSVANAGAGTGRSWMALADPSLMPRLAEWQGVNAESGPDQSGYGTSGYCRFVTSSVRSGRRPVVVAAATL